MSWKTVVMAPGPTDTLQLHKHEGAGNDFLVVIAPEATFALSPTTVRALCDRRRGLGADGVIVVHRGDGEADLGMVLANADGSEAEMSGNGIRCLAQAAVGAGLVAPPRFTVATAAGVRRVHFTPGEAPALARATVEMGVVALGPGTDEPGGRRTRRVDVGNPHLVVWGDDPARVDLAAEGVRRQAGAPGGTNVEFVAPGGAADELVLRVWERGVGETLACGTGSIAAAAAARGWGVCGDRVTVRNPGGVLEVTLGGAGEPALLGGPVRKVADVAVDLSTFS